MFEKLISDLLNHYLGAFVENLDSGQLGAALYKGSLLLENVQLKSTLFDGLPIPLRLKHGQVGRIQASVPFWSMFKAPVVLEVANVIGVLEARPIGEWDEEQLREAFVQT